MYCGREYTLYSLKDEHAKQRKINGNNLREFFKNLIPTDYNGNIKQHKLPPFLRLLGVPVTDAMKSGNPDGSKMSQETHLLKRISFNSLQADRDGM